MVRETSKDRTRRGAPSPTVRACYGLGRMGNRKKNKKKKGKDPLRKRDIITQTMQYGSGWKKLHNFQATCTGVVQPSRIVCRLAFPGEG